MAFPLDSAVARALLPIGSIMSTIFLAFTVTFPNIISHGYAHPYRSLHPPPSRLIWISLLLVLHFQHSPVPFRPLKSHLQLPLPPFHRSTVFTTLSPHLNFSTLSTSYPLSLRFSGNHIPNSTAFPTLITNFLAFSLPVSPSTSVLNSVFLFCIPNPRQFGGRLTNGSW